MKLKFKPIQKEMIYFKANFLLVLILLISILSGCDNKPYTLEDSYIYIQKEGRDKMRDSWELVWQEEFNSNKLDTTVWTKINIWDDADFPVIIPSINSRLKIGSPLNKEVWRKNRKKLEDHKNLYCFSYTTSDPNLYDFQDGKLILKGIVNKDTLTDPRSFLQGAIKSKRKFAFKYGKIEIRGKVEAAKGAWPAFWMLSEKEIYEKTPFRNGEMDIMERLNYDKFVYQTTHSAWIKKRKEENENQIPPYYATANFDPDGFNVFAVEWYPNKLVYSINGVTSYEYPKVEGEGTEQWPFDQPYYIMLDQQLSGGWVGQIDPKDLPVNVYIDWVRVYQ